MGRIRLSKNYTDGELRSVTFSKGQGQFTIPVGRSEHDTGATQDEDQQPLLRKSSLAAFLAEEKRKGR